MAPILEPLAKVMEGQDRKHDHYAGRKGAPGSVEKKGLGFGKHSAPAWHGGLNAEAQVTHGGFRQDGVGKPQHRSGKERRQEVGKNMNKDNSIIWYSGYAGSENKIPALVL